MAPENGCLSDLINPAIAAVELVDPLVEEDVGLAPENGCLSDLVNPAIAAVELVDPLVEEDVGLAPENGCLSDLVNPAIAAVQLVDPLVEEDVGLAPENGCLSDLVDPAIADVEPTPRWRCLVVIIRRRLPAVHLALLRLLLIGHRSEDLLQLDLVVVGAAKELAEPAVVVAHLYVGRVMAAGQASTMLHNTVQ